MTKQTRQFFDPTDILQLRIVCGHQYGGQPCDGEVLYQFGPRKIDMDWRCPKCGAEWKTQFPDNMPFDMRQVSPQESASMALLDALQTLSGPGCAPFTIRFEVGGQE